MSPSLPRGISTRKRVRGPPTATTVVLRAPGSDSSRRCTRTRSANDPMPSTSSSAALPGPLAAATPSAKWSAAPSTPAAGPPVNTVMAPPSNKVHCQSGPSAVPSSNASPPRRRAAAIASGAATCACVGKPAADAEESLSGRPRSLATVSSSVRTFPGSAPAGGWMMTPTTMGRVRVQMVWPKATTARSTAATSNVMRAGAAPLGGR